MVLGGIYTGWLTPVEAGAAGSLMGIGIAILRRSMTLRGFWQALLETGHITASILFLITAASIYSRMPGLAGLPNQLGDILAGAEASFFLIMLTYVALMLILGALPFAGVMLIVLILLIMFPSISLAILNWEISNAQCRHLEYHRGLCGLFR